MVARNLQNQLNAFHNPPSLDDSHWSQTSEESDIPSPVVFEHANFVTNPGRYHRNDNMDYRNPAYVLPPPSIHPGNHQGLQVSDLSIPASRQSYQRHSSSTHSPSPLEASPLSKSHIPGYDRIGQTGAINSSRETNRSHTNKSFPTGQSVIRATTVSNKSRPPRRSSANGVVACRQCRSRKIRCDSTRPGCENCSKRSTPCEYDAVPKRRGPDKRPGTRRRSCKKRSVDEDSPTFKRKKRRAGSDDDESDVTDYPTKYEDQSISPIDKSAVLPTVSSLTINTEVPRVGLMNGASSAEPDSRSSLSSAHHRSPINHIHQGPSMDYHRRTWWDNLLDTYSSSRAQSSKDIMSDLSFLFSTHTFWLPFINAPVFLQKLNDPIERMRMQPSLVIAALALATMIKSSNIELGVSGRERARNLGNAANAELQAALNTGALDHTLAEAALILTVYEFCPHPTHSLQRATHHLVFLDNLIRAQSLSFIDSQDPDVSTFAANLAPIIRFPPMYVPPEKCSCPSSSFLNANDALQSKVALPPWDPTWSSSEAHREECRRLCWSALSLAASQSVIYSAFDKQPLDLFLSAPSNFSIFFPGESAARGQVIQQQSPKESVWALFCRTLLLWCSCIRQKDEHRDNAEFAIDAWQETQAIQDALDTHICTDNSTLAFLCREYLHNSRMSITKEFRRSLQGVDNGMRNMFNIKHARDWLYHSDQLAKRIRSVISEQDKPLGFALARNPLEISWFATQVSICLRLWNFDRTLIEALEVAKSYLLSVDILNALFPCHASSLTRDELHEELEDACIFSGLQPPTRAEYSLPHPQSHHNYVQPTL